MIIFEDKTYWLDKGDVVPLICPKCQWPKEFTQEVADMVDMGLAHSILCQKCGHRTDWEAWQVGSKIIETQ